MKIRNFIVSLTLVVGLLGAINILAMEEQTVSKIARRDDILKAQRAIQQEVDFLLDRYEQDKKGVFSGFTKDQIQDITKRFQSTIKQNDERIQYWINTYRQALIDEYLKKHGFTRVERRPGVIKEIKNPDSLEIRREYNDENDAVFRNLSRIAFEESLKIKREPVAETGVTDSSDKPLVFSEVPTETAVVPEVPVTGVVRPEPQAQVQPAVQPLAPSIQDRIKGQLGENLREAPEDRRSVDYIAFNKSIPEKIESIRSEIQRGLSEENISKISQKLNRYLTYRELLFENHATREYLLNMGSDVDILEYLDNEKVRLEREAANLWQDLNREIQTITLPKAPAAAAAASARVEDTGSTDFYRSVIERGRRAKTLSQEITDIISSINFYLRSGVSASNIGNLEWMVKEYKDKDVQGIDIGLIISLQRSIEDAQVAVERYKKGLGAKEKVLTPPQVAALEEEANRAAQAGRFRPDVVREKVSTAEELGMTSEEYEQAMRAQSELEASEPGAAEPEPEPRGFGGAPPRTPSPRAGQGEEDELARVLEMSKREAEEEESLRLARQMQEEESAREEQIRLDEEAARRFQAEEAERIVRPAAPTKKSVKSALDARRKALEERKKSLKAKEAEELAKVQRRAKKR